MRRFRRLLFWLSRTRPMGFVVRLAFGRLWWLLPVRRVAQTARVLAFEHPAPSWQPHLLLVPKRSIRSLLAARPADAAYLGEIVRLGFGLAVRRGLASGETGTGFALLVNGGTYQDVPQLHVHLAGLDEGLRYDTPARPTPQDATDDHLLAQHAGLMAYRHPQPQRQVHAVIWQTGWPADKPLVWRDLAGPPGEEIGRALLPLTQGLVERLNLGSDGFTLLASVAPGGLDAPVCFHLVAGDRRA